MARAGRIRAGRGMVGGLRAGGGDVAGRAPRQGHRTDAGRVGHRLHSRGAARGGGAARLGMASAVRHRRGARAAHRLDPPQRARAARVEAGRRGARPSAAALFRPPLARRTWLAARHDGVRAVRLLGPVHVDPGLSFEPGGEGRRGHEPGALVSLDRADADRRFLRLHSFGFLADRFGRRPVFMAFVLGAAVLVPVYGAWGANPPC